MGGLPTKSVSRKNKQLRSLEKSAGLDLPELKEWKISLTPRHSPIGLTQIAYSNSTSSAIEICQYKHCTLLYLLPKLK